MCWEMCVRRIGPQVVCWNVGGCLWAKQVPKRASLLSARKRVAPQSPQATCWMCFVVNKRRRRVRFWRSSAAAKRRGLSEHRRALYVPMGDLRAIRPPFSLGTHGLTRMSGAQGDRKPSWRSSAAAEGGEDCLSTGGFICHLWETPGSTQPLRRCPRPSTCRPGGRSCRRS